MKAYQREVQRIARSMGFRTDEGKKHIRIFDGERLIAITPRSARERGRSHKNMLAALRRAVSERPE